MSLDDWAWLIATVAGAGVVMTLCRSLRLSRAATAVCVVVASGGTLLLTGAFLLVALDECVFGNDRPLAWQWSPRREFCDEEGSPARLGGLVLLLIPSALASLGAVLWSKARRIAAAAVFCLVVPASFLPWPYVEALPFYPIYETPVLHDPYLRVAATAQPARACYAYGIKHGPRATVITDEMERICVDLARTADAEALTGEYDEGVTIYALDWLGKSLTENGMDVGTEWEGLVVTRVYRLPGGVASHGAVLIRT